jgi:hypothetical protein
VKEKVRNQEIRLEFKSTKEQRADALTKFISGKAFFDERDKILGAKIAVELIEKSPKENKVPSFGGGDNSTDNTQQHNDIISVVTRSQAKLSPTKLAVQAFILLLEYVSRP